MIEWSDLIERLEPGDVLQPLAGSSRLRVESIDSEQLCLRQQLWRACLTPDDLRTAVAVLEQAPAGTTPLELAEQIRARYSSGSEVTVGCSRVPNLSAVVLHHLGAIV
ncbi:hypothetical protein H7X46_28060 [Pseudonocardia sp. C8]|uniref:hypothetical protein n=1 Tax=Pseudonocardia sp. C8 TaxID=2762759 RepID=UPI001642E7D7|nr:hypothetical protein [Pseudonocardia sp. C8]MBC3194913.1 hypothetical protein [Pseudonocardia sp. C8]